MNFYTDTIQKDPRFNGILRCADPNLLEPFTRAAVLGIIAEAPEPMMIFETYRSQMRQHVLFNQHATKLQHVGVHGFGLACDIVKVIDGQPSWEGDFSFLGPLARKYGMVWGGDWSTPGPHSFVDADHVQRINVSDQDQLFSGSWYPDGEYRPKQVL